MAEDHYSLSAKVFHSIREDKKEQVISSIEEQGKMTEELKEKILFSSSFF